MEKFDKKEAKLLFVSQPLFQVRAVISYYLVEAI
jgi:hypothetical protein